MPILRQLTRAVLNDLTESLITVFNGRLFQFLIVHMGKGILSKLCSARWYLICE